MAIVSLKNTVGFNATNKTSEVDAVIKLLRSAGLNLADSEVSESILVNKIKIFQRLCGYRSPDGRIDPNGKTLRVLNTVTNPLEFNLITHPRSHSVGKVYPNPSSSKYMNVRNGGYGLHYSTAVKSGYFPEPYYVYLGTRENPLSILLSNRNLARKTIPISKKYGIMNLNLLISLLKFIDKNNFWSKELEMCISVALTEDPEKLQSLSRPVIISISNSQKLFAPVKPLNDNLLPLAKNGNGKLTYQGNPKSKKFWGRMLYKPNGFKKNLFIYAGELELDDKMRGFDCITYVGAVCNAQHTKMTDSVTLSNHLGAAPVRDGKVELTKVKASNIRDYFIKKKEGYFLLWSGGHIVLVANNEVHEFSPKSNGYIRTDAVKWLSKKTYRMTIKKMKNPPAHVSN